MQKYKDQLQGLRNLYHVTGIPFIVASTNGEVVLSYPEGSGIFYQAAYWMNAPMGSIKHKHPNEVTLFEVGEFCYVAVVKLDINLFLSTVPVRSSNNIPHSYFPVLVQGVEEAHQVDFFRLLLDVPPKTDYQLAEFASLAKIIYCGVPADGINFQYFSDKFSDAQPPASIQILETLTDNNKAKHISLDIETHITKAISTGDRLSLEDALNRPTYGVIGKMSLNELRQAKYQFICMMFLSCRAAVLGGAPEEYSFSLSDSFCKKMDSMNSISEIDKYLRICMLKFCEIVSEYGTKQTYSTYTNAAIDYISQHLLEPLSVETISTAVGLNRKSLSQYFKKDLGITIPDYILEKRLTEAEYLLKNSNISLSGISELLQFASQSHFTQRFKEKYGVTPKAYRG